MTTLSPQPVHSPSARGPRLCRATAVLRPQMMSQTRLCHGISPTFHQGDPVHAGSVQEADCV